MIHACIDVCTILIDSITSLDMHISHQHRSFLLSIHKDMNSGQYRRQTHTHGGSPCPCMRLLKRKEGGKLIYRKVSNIRRTLVGYEIVYHSNALGASPVGAAPTTSPLSTEQRASKDCAMTTARQDETHLGFGIECHLYQRLDGNSHIRCSFETHLTLKSQELYICQ